MDNTQFLLVKLAEEAQEVAQRALKAAQFGMSEVQKGQPLSNAERLSGEINDLLAAIRMLNSEAGFGFQGDENQVFRKIAKVKRFRAYSADLGLVDLKEITPAEVV